MSHLSDEELERLALLSEECAEVCVAIGKILRHGYQSYNPFNTDLGSNREQLEAELGDVLYCMELMRENGDIDKDSVEVCCELAAKSKPKYLHHQTQLPELKGDRL